MFEIYQYVFYVFIVVWIGMSIYTTMQHYQAMKADRSKSFNLFQLIGALFSELVKRFVSLFVISVVAGGALYLLWELYLEITGG